MYQDKVEKEMKECTFKPNISRQTNKKKDE